MMRRSVIKYGLKRVNKRVLRHTCSESRKELRTWVELNWVESKKLLYWSALAIGDNLLLLWCVVLLLVAYRWEIIRGLVVEKCIKDGGLVSAEDEDDWISDLERVKREGRCVTDWNVSWLTYWLADWVPWCWLAYLTRRRWRNGLAQNGLASNGK